MTARLEKPKLRSQALSAERAVEFEIRIWQEAFQVLGKNANGEFVNIEPVPILLRAEYVPESQTLTPTFVSPRNG